ncbi:unnamed protein product [Ectocarpus sp. 13 AM-2016]
MRYKSITEKAYHVQRFPNKRLVLLLPLAARVHVACITALSLQRSASLTEWLLLFGKRRIWNAENKTASRKATEQQAVANERLQTNAGHRVEPGHQKLKL